MARLEKAASGQKAAKKEDLSSFKNEKTAKRLGRLARLTGSFMLASALALPPMFAGQQDTASLYGGKVPAESTQSMFPTLERIASFKGKEKQYSKKAISMMNNFDAFIQRNGDNRAFKLVMEAIMCEVLGPQTERKVGYVLDYLKGEDKIIITDSLKNWNKMITICKEGDGVRVSVETAGEPKLSVLLEKGRPPSQEDISRLRLSLYNLFDDLFATDLFLRAANGD
jgi:hypothetical protein